jgi:hypothetical protein
MPCIWGQHNKSQLFPDVAVIPAASLATLIQPAAGQQPPSIQTFRALIDTGAQGTCITATVAKAIGLIPLGKKSVIGVSGVQSHNYYLFNVGFLIGGPVGPNKTMAGQIHLFATPIQGVELAIAGGNFDVLLGMDIIGSGSLAVEGSGTFSFSF